MQSRKQLDYEQYEEILRGRSIENKALLHSIMREAIAKYEALNAPWPWESITLDSPEGLDLVRKRYPLRSKITNKIRTLVFEDGGFFYLHEGIGEAVAFGKNLQNGFELAHDAAQSQGWREPKEVKCRLYRTDSGLPSCCSERDLDLNSGHIEWLGPIFSRNAEEA